MATGTAAVRTLGKRRGEDSVQEPMSYGSHHCPVDLTSLLDRYVSEHTAEEGCAVEDSLYEAEHSSRSLETLDELKTRWSLKESRGLLPS